MTYEEFKHLAEHSSIATSLPSSRLSDDVPLYLQRRFKGYLEKAEKKQSELDEKDRVFKQAHDYSIRNKEQIEKSEKCGCFSCGAIFSPSEITDYAADEEPTTLCPYCGIDSVIGDASGFPITPKFLKEMNKRWF